MEHKRDGNARTKESTAGTIADSSNQKIGHEWKFTAKPQFLADRLTYWNSLIATQKEKYDAFPHEDIKVTLPDGKVKEGKSFVLSPIIIAKSISNSLAEKVVVSKVKYSKRSHTLDVGLSIADAEGDGGEVVASEEWEWWDATRPFEGDCDLKLFTFDDKEGKETFWHSSAHVLGEALENSFGVHLCHGPPTDSGFFYDSYTGADIFQESNYKQIEDTAKKIVQEKQNFERLVLSKEEALKLFGSNPFKVALITNKIPDGKNVTAYRCGDLIDLCTGPHIPSTKMIKAFKVTKNSSAYWLGKNTNDSLQRVYGITFPSKKELDEYLEFQKQAALRDHRNVGRQQGLFDMHQMSPGSTFLYPHGTHIYNRLTTMLREQYRIRGYQEVMTPNVYNLKLWKTSGHYMNYKDNLFIFKVENQGFGMKPMNCPGHCLMFENQIRSYRELPIRFADFGVLHRNELSGALSGLTRVRRFQQDDAHHFCAPDQLEAEIMHVLYFLEYVYGLFGFKYELELSTRPEKRLGSEELWDQAESALEQALIKFGKPWKFNPGDGAFYGPKIDIKVYDALKRAHQCGTVQCDFQLPIRFNLQYKTDEGDAQKAQDIEKKEMGSQLFKKDEWDEQDFTWQEQPLRPGFKRPVMVHRAIYGSFERFIAILIEHLGGKWPFWLSPRQCLVCPISEKFMDYCESVYLYLHRAGYQVDLDKSNVTLNKKIRNGQLAQYNFILVAGEEEMKDGLVDIRTRDNKRMGKMRIDALVEHFKSLEPEQATKFEEIYKKAWDPKDYQKAEEMKGAEGPIKVYVGHQNNHFTQSVVAMCHLAGQEFEIVNVSKEDQESEDWKKKNWSGKFPVIETSTGHVIHQSSAIVSYIARNSKKLNGSSKFEEAQIDQWNSIAQSSFKNDVNMLLQHISGVVQPADLDKFDQLVAQLKKNLAMVEAHLKGKDHLVGKSMSVADLVLATSLLFAFQTVILESEFPASSKWFKGVMSNSEVVKAFGHVKQCKEEIRPAVL